MTTFVFYSRDPIPVVRDRILAEVGEPIMFRLSWPFASQHKLFSGTVSEDRFRLYRIIDHQNSYLPVAYGRFESHANGTRVVVQLRPNPFGLTVNILWTLGWGLPLIFTLARNGLTTPPDVWGPIAMIAGAWMLMIPAELVEDREYERAFRKVISGDNSRPETTVSH